MRIVLLLVFLLVSCKEKKIDYGNDVFICTGGVSYHKNKECPQLKKCSKDILRKDINDAVNSVDHPKKPCAICAY